MDFLEPQERSRAEQSRIRAETMLRNSGLVDERNVGLAVWVVTRTENWEERLGRIEEEDIKSFGEALTASLHSDMKEEMWKKGVFSNEKWPEVIWEYKHLRESRYASVAQFQLGVFLQPISTKGEIGGSKVVGQLVDYLQILADDEKRKWFVDSFSGFLRQVRDGDVEPILEIAKMDLIKPQRLKEVLSGRRSGSVVGKAIDPEFLASRPHLVELISVYDSYPRQGWDTKIKTLESFYSSVGMGERMMEEIERVMWRLYERDNPEKFAQAKENWEGSNEEERRRFLDQELWSRYSNNIQAIKKKIVDSLGVGERLARGLEESQAINEQLELKRIGWKEDNRHPLRHLRMSLGYEVEHGMPKWEAGMVMAGYYRVLDNLGFRRGADHPNEAAPGPFVWGETARMVWEGWYKGGLVNLHIEQMQTVHLNFGLPDFRDEDSVELVRWLQLTGLAYHPTSLSPGVRRFGHGYAQKGSERSKRVEFKEFDVVTGEGFAQVLEWAGDLGSALKMSLLKQKGYKLTVDQEKLAKVWERARVEVAQGMPFAGLGVAKVWPDVVTEIGKIYPNRWSRYSQSRVEREINPIEVNGVRYNNRVEFSQKMAVKYSNEARLVMEEAEAECIEQLRAISLMPLGTGNEKEQVKRAINGFFARFWCGSPREGEKLVGKLKRLSEVADAYGIRVVLSEAMLK